MTLRLPLNTFTHSVFVFLFDLLAALVAWFGGLMLHGETGLADVFAYRSVVFGIVLLVVHVVACRVAGLYRGIWIFASLPDLKRVLKAVATSTAALACILVFDRDAADRVPNSMLILFPLLLAGLMGGARAAWRMWKEYRLYGGLIGQGKPVVIVGAGSGGVMLVRELERSPDWKVVALVDDDRSKWGREVLGHPVVGGLDALPQALQGFKAQHVILAMPSAGAAALRDAADLAVNVGAQVFTIPGLNDVMGGKVAINAMRPIDIGDLLGREPVHIDTNDVGAMVAGRRILITGAGGSIGSELCRQLAHFPVGRLVLFDASEFALYTIQQWFADNRPDIDVIALIGDAKDEARLEQIFVEGTPDLVFHAAAYKHVPLMEVDNAWQAVRNNALGTLRVAEQALRHGSERFVLVSTDKAVSPTNVMGASKRLAEMICEALDVFSVETAGRTRFETVRFGNVLGSTGSVIPRFTEQIARGGPVTVTHPEIRRYFMSISEAAQLVLQAAAMGRGGEIFVLDMGEPVKIVDLARNMIRLSGYTEKQIGITFTGLRPGEKLYEELLADAEKTRPTPHAKLRIAGSRDVAPEFIAEVRAWLAQSVCIEDEEVRRALARWVHEYAPMGSRPSLRVVGGGVKLKA